MLYMTGAVKSTVWPHVEAGRLGLMRNPVMGNKYRSGPWAADTGCFNADKYVGDDEWWAWLVKNGKHSETCLFATAPDVVGDHEATLNRSTPWLPRIRALGYRAAFVAQDGATATTIPWDDLDALFIGGTDAFKLGPDVPSLVSEAKRRGKWVHMGRVNSRKRAQYAKSIGCDSVDGTVLAFDPARLTKVLTWTA